MLLSHKNEVIPSIALIIHTIPVGVSNTVLREAVQLAEGANLQEVGILCFVLFCFPYLFVVVLTHARYTPKGLDQNYYEY